VGDEAASWARHVKDAIKGGILGAGMLFEEMGFTYLGPIDGHDLKTLRHYIEKVKQLDGPVLLHVLTEKGHGFEPAAAEPVKFHAPSPFKVEDCGVVPIKSASSKAYTDLVSSALFDIMATNKSVAVITAAMCEGNKLQKIRENYPDQFFDTGICESHAVAFAGGMAKAGARPVVDIYSTFLQRGYDNIFQEVSLQNLPVLFTLDRAGVVGADGPTHHGTYDIAYMRMLPNMVVMAPGDEQDVRPMLDFALGLESPTSIRYPKTNVESVKREPQPIETGMAEVIDWETDGMFIVFGAQLPAAVRVANRLREEHGLRVGVINARFAKPLDSTTILKAIEEASFVLTIEEGCLMGGFGSAVLEAANDAGINTSHVRRLGLPDRFVLHAERDEQLAEVGLDEQGIYQSALKLAKANGFPVSAGLIETNGINHHVAIVQHAR
jgi:1-deoxy-D-xylulose-5-phosphate synthase